MTFRTRSDEKGKPTVKTPALGYPQTDVLHVEMPLRPEDVKYLLPEEPAHPAKPWVVLFPPGKQSLAMYALANQSFTLQETVDKVVVHPKLD
jgi:hypothetical protein